MPILKFQCHECGLSQRKRVSKGVENITCTCGSEALVEGSAPSSSIGFTAPIKNSMKVQDTGAESLDLDFDRVIGEDAKKKWDTIYRRHRDKVSLLEDSNGTKGDDIMRLPDGTYHMNPTTARAYREDREDGNNLLRSQRAKEK